MQVRCDRDKRGVSMETKSIMIVGVGGQGTLLTSRILGGVITEAGYDVSFPRFTEWLREAEAL